MTGARPTKEHPVPLNALRELCIAHVNKKPARVIAGLRKRLANAKAKYGWNRESR